MGIALRARLAVSAALTLLLFAGLLGLYGCSCSSQQSSVSAQSASSASASSSSSSAPTKVKVPNYVTLSRVEAEKSIVEDGFKIGDTKGKYSKSVKKGRVISQEPEAMTEVAPGTTIVLTVSKGKKKPKKVEMPNLVGMTKQEALDAVSDLGITLTESDPEVTDAVQPGRICAQFVEPGTKIDKGTDVVITLAVAEQTVAVPDLSNMTLNDAMAALGNNGLSGDMTTEYSDTVAKDYVIRQSVAPNTRVQKGTLVSLVISLGPAPAAMVAVPDIEELSLSDAIDALTEAGLLYRYSGDEAGNVVSVDPGVGTRVDVGSTVSFVLEKTSELIEIPDVSGMDGATAVSVLQNAGLDLDYNVRDPEAELSGTNPAAGEFVKEGTLVSAVYE